MRRFSMEGPVPLSQSSLGVPQPNGLFGEPNGLFEDPGVWALGLQSMEYRAAQEAEKLTEVQAGICDLAQVTYPL